MALNSPGETPAEELYGLVKEDLTDRKGFADRQRELEELRLVGKKRKVEPYPNAPDLREPLIDDNVVSITSAEMSIMFSTRVLATFIPQDEQALQVKADAEDAFDTLLRVTLRFRSKIEAICDGKNERGMGIAKLVENTTAVEGSTLPDFEKVDPLDVVVPTGTRHMQTADRVCHIIRYTPREFKEVARLREWDEATVKKLLKIASDRKEAGDAGEGLDDDEAGRSRQFRGMTTSRSHVVEVIVWEIYYWKEVDGVLRKHVIVMSPQEKADTLKEFPWRWPDKIQVTPVPPMIDPLMGTEIPQEPEVEVIEQPDRPWPFVQFRFENRDDLYHNVRGVGDKLEQDQAFAEANINAKAVLMDYCCKPFLEGGSRGGIARFRWRPGEALPDGSKLAIPPRVDPVFDYNRDLALASAARRVGAPSGAFSSLDKSKEAKTATEVSATAITQNKLSSDAVERFSEPLGELFGMMWEWLKYHPTGMPAIANNQARMIGPEIFALKFILVPGFSGRSANPDMILRQLMVLSQFYSVFPQAAMFNRGAELNRFLWDQIDPKITDMVTVNPQQAGGNTAPIEQQVAQLTQLIGGDPQSGAVGLAEQAHRNSQMVGALAAEKQAEDEKLTEEEKVANRAPVQE